MEQGVADRVVLTPAERALLLEQANAAQVALNLFMTEVENGTSGDAVRSFVEVVKPMEDMTGLLQKKVARAIHQGAS